MIKKIIAIILIIILILSLSLVIIEKISPLIFGSILLIIFGISYIFYRKPEITKKKKSNSKK